MENNNRRALRMPKFWMADPVSRFAHVETHLKLEDLELQQHGYLTRIPSGESIWGSRSKKDRLLNNQ